MKKLILKIQKLEESRIIQINRALNLSEMTIKESKEQLRKDFQISQEDFIILSIGRLVPRKRFDLVIRAIAKIKKKNPQINLKYFLIGKGRELPKLKDLAEKLSIKEEIKFLGSVSHEIKYRYYKLSDIFVMPSSIEKDSIEGFGIVFLEANYFKLPVIGTLSGGMKEAIIDEKTGFLVEPDDIDKIFEKILFLHDNPNIRKEMGEYGYNRVLKEYNWNIIVNDYEKIFNEIIHNNRK
ncbi:MAG: glycosyltransferase family 4 protein [Promethearchaeota archaeon]